MTKKTTKQKPLSGTARLLDGLTPTQAAAVTHRDGPLLIIAGAGTGKTTVITRRIAWLIAEGLAKPEEILALTFTDKAAAEMEERIDRLLPLGYVDLWVSTFHAFGERILRDHAIEVGLDPDFTVLSSSQQWLLLKEHLFDLDLQYYRPLGNPAKFLYALTSHFSRAKDEDVTPQDYQRYAADFALRKKGELKRTADPETRAALEEEIQKTEEIARAYGAYQKLLVDNAAMDFGDLITNALALLRQRKNLLTKFRTQFKYILVDEFQDTNYAQYQLVKMLAAPKNNLTVVGDDDQSIYKFRGAAISNILAFKEEYPETKEVVLTENFRSGQPILDLAYNSIQINNPDRLEEKLKINKKLVSQVEHRERPSLLLFDTIEQEVAGVVARILQLKKKEQASWDDFAILVRANAHAEPFLKALEQKEIPYEFVAARGLYAKTEVMDLVAYLRILNHHNDLVSFYRILTSPMFKIPMADVATLMALVRQKNEDLLSVLRRIEQFLGLQEASVVGAKKILALLTEGQELSRRKPVSFVLYKFLTGTEYVKNLLATGTLESTKKVMNINQFFKSLGEFERRSEDSSVRAYIRELDLLQEAGEDPAPATLEEGPEAVKVMTVHAAKGLEFPYVFLVNLVDQRFPIRRRGEQIPLPAALIKERVGSTDDHLAEERRLFYVGLTRAKKGLYLVAAADYGGARKRKLSQLVREVKEHYAAEDTAFAIQPDVPDLAPAENLGQKKHTVKLPERFSYTQLAAFKNCPRQYYYAHVLRIPVLGSHTFSYGKSLHMALAEFYKLLQKGGPKPELPTLLDLLERFWISDWYHSKAHEQKQKKQAVETLTKFYENNQPRFRAPKFIEQNFNLKIGDYTIRGAIDRVDVQDDGSVELIDYKTGRLKKQKDVDKDDQLSLYALALEKVFNLHADTLALYYLDEGRLVTTKRAAKDLERIEKEVIDTINQIVVSDFAPTPGFQCSHCDFLAICEAGQKEVGRG